MGSEFGKGQGTLPILLSHTHLDHIQGLPFFTPFFIKGNEIRILGANPIVGLSLEATLQNQLAPHYSPLNGLENLAAGVSIETHHAGRDARAARASRSSTAAVPHGSMWTTALPDHRRRQDASRTCPTSSTRRPTSRCPRRSRSRATPTC